MIIWFLIVFLLGVLIGAFIETYRVQVNWGIEIGTGWRPPK